MGKRKTTNAESIIALQRRRDSVSMRLSGMTYSEIAEALGVTKSTVFKHVKAYFAEVQAETKEEGEQLREMEAERLDKLQAALWELAKAGDTSAIDRVLKIMKQRAELLGLEAPKKIAPTTPDGMEAFRAIVEGEKIVSG